MRTFSAALALVALVGTGLSAQTTTAPTQPSMNDRVAIDIGGGMSRYGPHSFASLEIAMNRWLALKGEGLFSVQQRRNWPDYRFTALSVTNVLTVTRAKPVTPYVFGGFALSASQGLSPQLGPVGGLGVRLKLGRFEPFLEARAQHRIGIPISLGIRF